MNPAQLFAFLEDHGLHYEVVQHAAVFTSEQAEKEVPPLPAAKTKNLFVRDDKGKRHFLISVAPEKSVDLKKLAQILGVKGLMLAQADRLLNYLGVEPGSVTILALINDTGKEVSFVIDTSLWQSDSFQCHPLVNTATVSIAKAELERFVQITGHEIAVIDVPQRV